MLHYYSSLFIVSPYPKFSISTSKISSPNFLFFLNFLQTRLPSCLVCGPGYKGSQGDKLRFFATFFSELECLDPDF